MSPTDEKILTLAKIKGRVLTSDVAKTLAVSRQYANTLVRNLVTSGQLIKIGSTRKSFYILPESISQYQTPFVKTLNNIALNEMEVFESIEKQLPFFAKLPENVRSVFSYAFSEMMNNAIEHSQSKQIKIAVTLSDNILSFVISDSGIGVFKSIQQKKNLPNELEAIQEILKGKTTSMPKSHSGEGIFFTARSADQFILDSYGYKVFFNNELPDVFVEKTKKITHGTKVIFKISSRSEKHLNDVFSAYTNLTADSDYGFDKTDIHVKLYTSGGVCVSRSQARRILSGLEKFKIILFDYGQVPMIGQAFADEIYRVFHNAHPEVRLENINMNETVEFMIKRAKTEAARRME